MEPYSKYFVVEFLTAIIAVFCAAYVYMKYISFNYWSSRNIKSVKPTFPVGSLWPVFSLRLSMGEFFRDKYLEFKKYPVFGFYTLNRPSLVVNDPELIRIILVKEFARFHDRGTYCNEKIDPLSAHLFALPGAQWRYLRTKFTPTFTASKMKQMFFTVKESADVLIKCLEESAKESEVIDMKETMARLTTDIIGSAAFGLQCNSLQNPDEGFRKAGTKFFTDGLLRTAGGFLVPKLLEIFRVAAIDPEVSDFFINAFKQTVEYRSANKVDRKDFLDLVMQLMNKGFVEGDDEKEKFDSADRAKKITFLEGAAQAFVFWLGGFETSSTLMTWCLHEMSLHQDIQDKLAEEVDTVLEKFGGLSYESVNAMPYLHKVVSETLRKYPILPVLNRTCTEEFDLPGIGLRIAQGTPIIISAFGIHWDPEIYPEPEKFDPERFSPENIASRHPYTYLPFGEGPRNCIGMRFGLVQSKVGIISVLSKYRFKPTKNSELPMPLDKRSIAVSPLGGMHLQIEMR